jgi:sporulation protein YlmC with PRC-barrel domain
MMLKTAASVTALTLAFGIAGAAAQTTAPQQPAPMSRPAMEPKIPIAGQIVTQDANTVLATDLIGESVYGLDKVKIGKISDLIFSKDGKSVEGIVIGVGGFLGIGEKSVALKMDRLQMSRDQDGLRLVMDVRKEELANAPSFKSKRDQDAEKQAAERARERFQIPAQPGGPTQRPGMN